MDQLGKALREVRLSKGMSLRAVATAADISPSLLSQVETGKTHPSVGTLYALVSVLHTSIDKLLDVRPESVPDVEPSPVSVPGGPVQRAAENPTIVMENGVTWERLAFDGSGTVDALLTTYVAGASSSVDGKFMRHSGIEFGYLIEGELTLRLEFDTHVLRAGDSVCFDSLRPHLYENRTDQVARGVWYVLGHSNGAKPVGGYNVNSASDVLSVLDRLPRVGTGELPAGPAGSPRSPDTSHP